MTTPVVTLVGAFAPLPLIAEGAAPGGGLMQMLPIFLMFGVIYFVVLRPMSNQEKERKKRIEAIKKGDKVVLQGGILGRISSLDDTIADINRRRDAAIAALWQAEYNGLEGRAQVTVYQSPYNAARGGVDSFGGCQNTSL